jgi:hypothetical protein
MDDPPYQPTTQEMATAFAHEVLAKCILDGFRPNRTMTADFGIDDGVNNFRLILSIGPIPEGNDGK